LPLRRTPGPLLVAAILVAALLVAGCGHRGSEGGKPHAVGGEEQSRQTEAQTEAIYVDIGGLKYQVQLSRILNPFDVEDHAYLLGLPRTSKPLTRNETWFGIFMRVENDGGPPSATPTNRYEIFDTDRNVYRPIPLNPAANPFAYAPQPLHPGQIEPSTASVAGQGPVQGELLLFRMALQSFQNRPLRLRFRDPVSGEIGVVDLDV
jgi:hypothetical protein